LVQSYPRGQRELRGPFSRFQPRDTVAWFARRGVELKVESDGRMFPTTDRSETIVDCWQHAARAAGVEERFGAIVKGIARTADAVAFELTTGAGVERFDRVLLATGSGRQGHAFAAALGHQLVDAVPSLFTFNVRDPALHALAGVSVPDAVLHLVPAGSSALFTQRGPLLVTHWGLSGPAVLKLSAWAARELFTSDYRAELKVNLLGGEKTASVLATLQAYKQQHGKRAFATNLPVPLPKSLLAYVTGPLNVDPQTTWANVTGEILTAVAKRLTEGVFAVDGKGVFKDEFVTCGGVDRREVDFRTMESKRCPGLFFAGEVLDIDGITGGFNFQNAWTSGWIAGHSLAAP
jgi:predicted Rossmann fold flavoprotein